MNTRNVGSTSVSEGYTTFPLWQSLTRPSKVNKITRGGLFYVVHFTNSNLNGLTLLNLRGSVVVLSPIQTDTLTFRLNRGLYLPLYVYMK